MRIRVNKIASVTRGLDLGYELALTTEIIPQAGAVIAGRVLTDKTTYNTLEDIHGRMSKLKSGDIVVGALGHRQALHGYEGLVPAGLAAGETIQLLNLGGVLGNCTSYNPNVGPPFDVEVLGQVQRHPVFQSRRGEPAFIPDSNGSGNGNLYDGPVVLVCGACMNSGKTVAASAVVNGLSRRGLNVGGAKLTGVSLLRDTLVLKDYGASRAYDFTDVGYTSTDESSAPVAARRVFALLAEKSLDVVVVEMGDGIFGRYGVQEILGDPELSAMLSLIIYCANDPAGAYGGVRELSEQYGLTTDIVSGPVTDNLVGRRYIEEQLGLKAVNARRDPLQLADAVFNAQFNPTQAKEADDAD